MPSKMVDRQATAERLADVKRKEGYAVVGPTSREDGWLVTWDRPAAGVDGDAIDRLRAELRESFDDYDIKAAVAFTTGRFGQATAEAAVRYAAASRAMIQAGLNPDPTA